MRLTLEKRERVVQLFLKYNLAFEKYKYHKLSQYAELGDIQLSERGARNLINKWQQTGSVADLKSPRRGQFRIKITEGDLHRINRAVSYYRELTA